MIGTVCSGIGLLRSLLLFLSHMLPRIDTASLYLHSEFESKVQAVLYPLIQTPLGFLLLARGLYVKALGLAVWSSDFLAKPSPPGDGVLCVEE